MSKKQELSDEQRGILSQCLWDLNLTSQEFLDILEGRSDKKWPDRAFCTARLLESVNWFDIVEIMKPKDIYALWNDKAKKYVRFGSIKEGMDFASRILSRNIISASG